MKLKTTTQNVLNNKPINNSNSTIVFLAFASIRGENKFNLLKCLCLSFIKFTTILLSCVQIVYIIINFFQPYPWISWKYLFLLLFTLCEKNDKYLESYFKYIRVLTNVINLTKQTNCYNNIITINNTFLLTNITRCIIFISW